MDEALAPGRPHQAREPPGHLHHGQARLVLPVRGAEQHGEVEAEAGQHRERPRGVDGERGEGRQDLVAEVAGEVGAGRGLEVAGAHQRMPRSASGGRISPVERRVELLHHGVGALGDPLQLLGGVSPATSGAVSPSSSACLSAATRTMKNSSRLEAAMQANFSRSSSGFVGSQASSRTRPLNSSQDSSRLRKSSGSRFFGFFTSGSPRGRPACGRKPRSAGRRGRARRGARG